MTAIHPQRRNIPAKVMAAKYGISERSVRNVIAEPREDFEARGQQRQDEALVLRAQGLSHAQVGKVLGVSRHAAAGLVRRAQQRHQLVAPLTKIAC